MDNLLITYKTVLTKSAPQKNLWTISGAYKKVLLKGREEKVEEERTWFLYNFASQLRMVK